MEIFLSSRSNFRDSIATIKVYKGNRDPLHRPHWYDEIREYLKSVWKAEEEEHLEADDILANLQSNNTCIVTTDKDLDQIDGWHYNWVKDMLYEVSLDQAVHNKYVQILTGDSTDNIEGIPGMGPVGAEERLKWCSSIEDYEQVIKEEYEYFFDGTEKGVQKCNEYGMTWDEILEETRQLITLGEIKHEHKSE
jgi:5'-3' exonuclease